MSTSGAETAQPALLRRAFPKGWGKRLYIWLTWVALFASIPYLAVFFTSAKYAGELERMTGQGQLIVTSVAISGGMLREIWMVKDPDHWTRHAIPGLVVYCVLCGIFYGQIMYRIIDSNGVLPPDQQHSNSIQSLILAGIAVGVALVVLIATTSPEEHA